MILAKWTIHLLELGVEQTQPILADDRQELNFQDSWQAGFYRHPHYHWLMKRD